MNLSSSRTHHTGATNLTLLLSVKVVVGWFMKDWKGDFTFPQTLLPVHTNIQRRRIFVYFDSVIS